MYLYLLSLPAKLTLSIFCALDILASDSTRCIYFINKYTYCGYVPNFFLPLRMLRKNILETTSLDEEGTEPLISHSVPAT